MNDYLIRAISRDGFVKAVGITSMHLTERARQIHGTTPVATAALGRALTAASMMGNMQKVEDGSLTLQFCGGGPIGTILVVSDAIGNVRGCVTNPKLPLLEKQTGKLDVGTAVGTNGMLTVIRDLRMKEPYVGSIALVSGEIAEDVTAYFAQSEQTPTACALGVLVARDQTVQAAGGYLLQLLPGAPDDTIDRLERGIQAAGAVTPMLDRGMTPEQMLSEVMHDFELEFLEKVEVGYRCNCSRERVAGTLITLGREDLEKIVSEAETVHVGCRFCDAKYDFAPADVQKILNSL